MCNLLKLELDESTLQSYRKCHLTLLVNYCTLKSTGQLLYIRFESKLMKILKNGPQYRKSVYNTVYFSVYFIHIYDFYPKSLLLNVVNPVACRDLNIKWIITTAGTTNFILTIKYYMFRPIKVIIRLVQSILKEYRCTAKNEISFFYQTYLIFIQHFKKCTLKLK